MVDGVAEYVRPDGLPLYEHPPVTEVTMSFNFLGPRIRAVDLGRLQEAFAELYPDVDERAPVPQQVETFGPPSQPSVSFQLIDRPPTPMIVLLDPRNGRLIQIQADRFACSWRKKDPDDTYPDYATLRTSLRTNLGIFENFVDTPIEVDTVITQAEITYVNDIPLEASGGSAEIANVLTIIGPPGERAGLPPLEDIRVLQRFTYVNDAGAPAARLSVAAEPVARADGSACLRLALTFRGEPHSLFGAEAGVGPMLDFFDKGHEQIVWAFTEVTTPAMHERWGRVR